VLDLTSTDDHTQIRRDSNLWSILIHFPHSISESQCFALESPASHKDVQIERQQSRDRNLFRVFRSTTSTQHIDRALSNHQLVLQCPIDLDPEYPCFVPHSLLFWNRDVEIEDIWIKNCIIYKRLYQLRMELQVIVSPTAAFHSVIQRFLISAIDRASAYIPVGVVAMDTSNAILYTSSETSTLLETPPTISVLLTDILCRI
jgi:hypothetical protein